MHSLSVPANQGFGGCTEGQFLILASAKMRKTQTTAVGQLSVKPSHDQFQK